MSANTTSASSSALPSLSSAFGALKRASGWTSPTDKSTKNTDPDIPERFALKRRATTTHTPHRAQGLLGCLAAAQACNIDLTGISWQESLGQVGRGGQGEIFQSDISIKDKFVFKRNIASEKRDPDALYQEIISEILALGHSRVREHPNIIRLEAICWEVGEKSWLQIGRQESVWPVIILEKAPLGDLERFMRSTRGKDLSLEDRMQICAELASAIKTMHTNNIIHGDIKPKNCLMFDEEGKLTPKLTDFGYSTIHSVGSDVKMPVSVPWDAPELQRPRKVSLAEAKKMDVYSFGALCLWALFQSDLETSGQSLPDGWGTRFVSAFYSMLGLSPGEQKKKNTRPDVAQLAYLRSHREMQPFALELVKTAPLSLEKRDDLRTFFDWTLCTEAEARGTDFSKIIPLLGQERRLPASDIDQIGNFEADFSVTKSLHSFCQTDYRVRRKIYSLLVEQYDDPKASAFEKLQTAFQLSLCTKIGFGTTVDDEASQTWLARSGRSLEDLELEIESTKKRKPLYSERLRDMYDTGIIKPLDHALEYRQSQNLDEHTKICEDELEAMSKVLGTVHPAIFELRSTLEGLYMHQGNPKLLELVQRLCKDIREADPDGQVYTRELLNWRNDLGITLMAHAQVAEGEEVLRENYDAATRVYKPDHVFNFFAAMNLAHCYMYQGRAKAAHDLGESAQAGFKKAFGDAHQYNVGVRAMKHQRLLHEGKLDLAIEEQRQILDIARTRMGVDHPGTVQEAMMLIKALIVNGQVKDASDVNNELRPKLKNSHPACMVLDVQVTPEILMHERKYQDAAQKYDQGQRFLASQPWPPPEMPGSKSAGGKAPPLPGIGGMDPKEFPNDPVLLICRAEYAVAMQAQSELEKEAKNDKEASRCLGLAKHSLSLFMADMAKVFEKDGPWPETSDSDRQGLEASALHAAMSREHAKTLELLVRVGAGNDHGGLHYREAIQVASEREMSNTVAILREQQLLCSNTRPSELESVPQRPTFDTVDGLCSFISGDWQGAYLYRDGGMRMDKKGTVTASFAARPKGDQKSDGVVTIHGSGRDDRGKLEYQGEASCADGQFTIFVSIEGEGVEMAWQQSGYLNTGKVAMGGVWGFRNAVVPLGTLFYYKLKR